VKLAAIGIVVFAISGCVATIDDADQESVPDMPAPLASEQPRPDRDPALARLVAELVAPRHYMLESVEGRVASSVPVVLSGGVELRIELSPETIRDARHVSIDLAGARFTGRGEDGQPVDLAGPAAVVDHLASDPATLCGTRVLEARVLVDGQPALVGINLAGAAWFRPWRRGTCELTEAGDCPETACWWRDSRTRPDAPSEGWATCRPVFVSRCWCDNSAYY
jgi:hypothetical protein